MARKKIHKGSVRSTPDDYIEEFPIGRKIERWTIIGTPFRNEKRRWKVLCLCTCGVEKTVQLNALRPLKSRGGRVASKSCGCHNLDVRRNRLSIGYRSGRLSVVKWLRQSVRPNGRPGDSVYLCRCDCGNEIEITSKHIHSPNSKVPVTQSCGCLARELTSKRTSEAIRKGSHANATHAYVKDGELIHGMRSSWELAFAYDYCDANNKKFEYESETFDTPNGKYTPDFYLPETNEYVEVKGLWRPKAKQKYDHFSKTNKTHLVNGDNLEEWTGLTDHQAREKYRYHTLYDLGFSKAPTRQRKDYEYKKKLVLAFFERFPPYTGRLGEQHLNRGSMGAGDFLVRWLGVSRTQQQRYRTGKKC
jgi:hypothetical protein